jgi:hypothetical protein
VGPLQARKVHGRSKALGPLLLVAAAGACLEIDSRDIEEDEGASATSGTGGTVDTESGSAGESGSGGVSPGGSGTTQGSGATNATAGSGMVANTGGSAAGAPPSAGGGGGAGGTSGGSGGASSGRDATGGTQGGTAGAGGSSGSPSAGMGGSGTPITCEGPRNELTIDGTHWIPGDCNDYEIEGAWYCITDEIADDDCDHTTSQPRYDDQVVGYCISGTTILDAEFKAWGATLAFELHNDGAAKSSYDATAHGVVGFELTVQGITSGNPLRVTFTPTITGVDPSPFVEYPSLEYETRTLTTLIEDAIVPPEWEVASAGDVPDPTAIVDVQLQVVGAQREAPYEFCITQVVPIVGGSN